MSQRLGPTGEGSRLRGPGRALKRTGEQGSALQKVVRDQRQCCHLPRSGVWCSEVDGKVVAQDLGAGGLEAGQGAERGVRLAEQGCREGGKVPAGACQCVAWLRLAHLPKREIGLVCDAVDGFFGERAGPGTRGFVGWVSKVKAEQAVSGL